MKVAVYGLWHLGIVTAACLAEKGFHVLGIDDDKEVISGLKKAQSPVFEPSLDKLIEKHLDKNLNFTFEISEINSADIIWVTFDTPVDDNDKADTKYVTDKIELLFPYISDDTVILISSQLPVGTTNLLQKKYQSQYTNHKVSFAYSPENLRLGNALETFNNPERIIIGTNNEKAKETIKTLLEPFCSNLIWAHTTSAEMIKHSLNAFLATSITFINEIACLCEVVDADVSQVELGLKSEPRIGKKAYLRPGGSFAGGTLARDVLFLCDLAKKHNLNLPMLNSLIPSNKEHKDWVYKKIQHHYKNLKGRKIALLGLTYKSGTNTLRRSSAIELAQRLKKQGSDVNAYDPNIKELPEKIKQYITLVDDIEIAYKNADALIIMNDHELFRRITSNDLVNNMKKPLVIDQNNFLGSALRENDSITLVTLGVSGNAS